MESDKYKHKSSHVGHIAFVVLAFLIGGIVGFAVGVGWESANNTEDTAAVSNVSTTKLAVTADWKTYTNTDYSYSIKYPNDWTVDLASRDSSGKAVPVFLAPRVTFGPHSKDIDIQVSPTSRVSKIGSADYLANNHINPIISQTSITVGGVATSEIISSLNNGHNINVYVDKGTNTYSFSLDNTTSSDSSYISTFNNMLSTFQFTK